MKEEPINTSTAPVRIHHSNWHRVYSRCRDCSWDKNIEVADEEEPEETDEYLSEDSDEENDSGTNRWNGVRQTGSLACNEKKAVMSLSK